METLTFIFSDDDEITISTNYIINAPPKSGKKQAINNCEYSEPNPDTNHADPNQENADGEAEEAVEHLEKKNN